ncbi:hypothetical protein K435DRAFT_852389 [Dendrothele bispora CBS 962.96]|uniref:Uncharacterized protein n=1 Tax=Dendrothele bispora (strain CBS 962.96) TaxID=1314807 RepID=A0A4S8MJM9_DENBC|nr:hypothetical protein K435DRAFT_852389 [Dendrothele bispora CBS 962.96]
MHVKCNICGRTFSSQGGLDCHTPICPARKQAQNILFSSRRKRPRTEDSHEGFDWRENSEASRNFREEDILVEGGVYNMEPGVEGVMGQGIEGEVIGQEDDVGNVGNETHDLNPETQLTERRRVVPARFEDFIVSNQSALTKARKSRRPLPSLSPPLPTSPQADMTETEPEPELEKIDVFRTEINTHNLFRIYQHRKPSQDPDAFTTTNDVADAPTFESANPKADIETVFGPASPENTPSSDSPSSNQKKNPTIHFKTFQHSV